MKKGSKQVRKNSNPAKSTGPVKKKSKAGLIVLAVVVVLLIAAGLAGYFSLNSAVNKVAADVAWDNLYIGDIDVSGMKADEVKAALEKQEAQYQSAKITLIAEEASVEVTISDLGFSVSNIDELVDDVISYGKEGSLLERYSQIKELETKKKVFEEEYKVDTNVVEKTLEEKIPTLENAAKDATITRENGVFVVTQSEKGVAIDAAKSTEAIETFLNKEWDKKSGSIELVTTIDEPKITTEQLSEVKDLLGSFTTTCGTGGGRVQNIVTGAGLINGAVIMPGEEYSANAAMEPYTYDNGYAEAGSYENGKVVQSMGGGICQVSSTLYNAVILAELEIVERAAHSMLVSYVEPSMDAAIAGDFKDLKFKNNTETPIYIEGYVTGGKITFNVYGKETRSADRTIEYVSEVVSSTPAGKKFVATGDAVGSVTKASSGYTGMKAKLWKVVKEGGVEVSREVVNNSTYSASAAVYNVGTASEFAEVTAAINSAISSQSEDAINAAIALQNTKLAEKAAAEQAAQQQQTGDAGATGTPAQ